jgi:hypothetical protein
MVELKTAPVVSCRDSIGQPLSVHDPGVALVSVTLAEIVPAAPSPSTYAPVKSLAMQVVPTGVIATVVVVVLTVVDVVDVVVVVVVPRLWRLIVKMTTIAAKMANDLSARLTD